AYQSCYGTAATVTPISVNSADPNADSGSGEAALDIEDVIGLAPHAAVDVYDSTNDSGGRLMEWARIATDDDAVVTTSWGACEASADPSDLDSERIQFEQMAAQGQTV